jgi:poly(A) polymerase
MTAPETRAVVAALTAGGSPVRFVGGCVRDAVHGRPIGDVDIATPDDPGTVTRLLEAAGLRAVPTGIAHGTVTAVVDGTHFEITTLRRDVETDGRHARVEFTDDWEADAARRDLTINALSCAPDGTLHDYFGGLDDLRCGRVRFVGGAMERIREDLLRLLRFFRFQAWYGRPPPDAEALEACRSLAPELPRLSGERVRDELLRILGAPHPEATLALMIEVGALGQVLPEVTDPWDPGALAALVAIEGEAPDPLRRLALLLRAGGDASAVAGRLRLANAQTARLAAMAAPAVAITGGLDVTDQRRALYRLGRAPFADLVHLAWAEAGDTGAPAFTAMLETARAWQAPRLPVKGRDAIALGMPQGPAVGELMAAIETWWIAGDFRATRKQTLAKLRELVGGVE